MRALLVGELAAIILPLARKCGPSACYAAEGGGMRRDSETPEIADSGKQKGLPNQEPSPSLGAPDCEAWNRPRTDLFCSATSRAQP
jgi:hypothetical protein